jgi:excisionase family DNA binding protein
MNGQQQVDFTKINWWNVKQAAEYFRTSESSVRRWIKKGILRACKPGSRDWLINPADCYSRIEKSFNITD